MESENLNILQGLSPEEKTRRRQKIEDMSGKVNERSFRLYLQYFSLKPQDLKDKRILDIGAGLGNFARIAQKEKLKLVSVDPVYKLDEKRETFRTRLSLEDPSASPRAMASWAEELALRDESFDLIFYNYSAFRYAESGDEYKRILDEAIRVLKPGGKILIFPLKKAGFEKAVLIPAKVISDSNPELFNDFQRLVAEYSEKGLIKINYRDHSIIDSGKEAQTEDPKFLKYMEIEKI